MGRRIQQTGRRRARVALFEARVVLRLEPETVSRHGTACGLFQRPAAMANFTAVQFTDVSAAQAGPDLINVAGIASFDVDEGAPKLSVKITWVIVREDGDWKIVSHHVSSKAPLI